MRNWICYFDEAFFLDKLQSLARVSQWSLPESVLGLAPHSCRVSFTWLGSAGRRDLDLLQETPADSNPRRSFSVAELKTAVKTAQTGYKPVLFFKGTSCSLYL